MDKRLPHPFPVQWGLLALALMMLGGIITYNLFSSYVSTGEQERQRLLTQARVIAENLEQQLVATDNALTETRHDIATYLDKPSYPALLNRRFKVIERSIPGIRTLAVMDRNGIVRLSNRHELLGINLVRRDYFQKALRNPDIETLFLSPPFKTVLGAWGMNLVRVIHGGKGEFAGIITATLDQEYFKTLLGSVNYAPDMWSAVGHGDGIQFMMVPQREGMSGKNVAQPGSFFSRHRQSGKMENVLTGKVYATGEERMMASRTIKPAMLPMDKPLVITTGRTLAAIYENWRKDALIQGGVFAVIMVTSVLGLATFQRRKLAYDRSMRQAEEQLRRHEHDLSAILDNMPSMIGYWDRELCNRFGNSAYNAWFGIDPDRMNGCHIREIIGEERYQLNRPYIEGALGGEAQVFERAIPSPDGRQVRYSLAQYVPDMFDGEVRGFYAFVHDITPIKEAENALRESNAALIEARAVAEAASRAKSEFLANMSHEIRTPLNAVVGFTQLALDSEPAPPQQNYLSKIRTSSITLLGIINDILDYSKIDAGRLELERVDFDLEETLRNVSHFFQSQIDKKGLDFSIDIGPDVPHFLRGDPLRLGQVLSNLIGNAVKFTETGGIRVGVETVERDEARIVVRFTVRDTGVGLSREQAECLFQPFTQADSSITRRFGGTGLGLTISRRLVELMGGVIDMSSTQGQGSMFVFTARFAPGTKILGAPRGNATAAITSYGMVDSIRGARILLVEDNGLNREVARGFLEKAGFCVIMGRNGAEGVQLAATAAFDAVLMDLHMPEMDGFEACRLIRALPGWEAIPIIAMTAAAMAEDRQACVAAGMNDHVAKPIIAPELLGTLLKWIAPGFRSVAVAPPLPATSREPLPVIQGMDVPQAMLRLGGDRILFDTLLAQLVEQVADDVPKIRADLAAGKQEQAAVRLHTLRGVIGNFSALEIMELSGQAENAIRQSKSELVPSLLARLESAMERLLSEVRRYLDSV